MADRLLKVTRPMLRGEDVLDVQNQLTALGHDPGPVDGIYGPQTAAAVRAFQESADIDVDAIVGPKTLAALAARQEPETGGAAGGEGGEAGGDEAGGGGQDWDGLRKLLEADGITLNIDWNALPNDPQSAEELPEELWAHLEDTDDEDEGGEVAVAAVFTDQGLDEDESGGQYADAGYEEGTGDEEGAGYADAAYTEGTDQYAASDEYTEQPSDGDENYG